MVHTSSVIAPLQRENAVVSLLSLPTEIIGHILGQLGASDLNSLTRTCHRLHKLAEDDLLWARLARDNLPNAPESPWPSFTWKSLYTSHHPYWFLPKHKIWFSDHVHTGKLILVKYDPRRGSIEGCRLLCSKGETNFEDWSYRPSVTIHSFQPRVTLHRDRPVLKMNHPSAPGYTERRGSLKGEFRMRVGADRHDSIYSSLFLSRAIPKPLQDPSMELWPPSNISAAERVRNASQDRFQGWGHKPHKDEEICQSIFRLRTWMQFSSGGPAFGVRMGEEVSTWSTLDPAVYAPTKEKPFQGIYVGDYGPHNCEFILVTQTDTIPELPDPEWSTDGLPHNDSEPISEGVPDDPIYKGRLEAIKLTGDLNVPRGEYTWFANDIGPAGSIRIAEEEPFRGARIVRSQGQLADPGFQDSKQKSIPADLT